MPGLKMSAMNVGPLTCAKNLIVALAPGTIDMPTTAAVIEHPKFGVVVWDTGINDAVADPARADDYWGKGLPAAFGTHNFTRQHAVDKQLEKLGYKPADVRYVIYSHLHLDHAGGMSYFPNAVHVVQRDEIRYALWPDQWTRPVYCQNDGTSGSLLNLYSDDSAGSCPDRDGGSRTPDRERSSYSGRSNSGFVVCCAGAAVRIARDDPSNKRSYGPWLPFLRLHRGCSWIATE